MMDPFLYQPVFLAVITLCCLCVGIRCLASSGYALQEEKGGIVLPLLFCVAIALWIGFRPVSIAFGDTVNYASIYRNLLSGTVTMDWSGEWIWQWLMFACKGLGWDIRMFFFVVQAGYVFSSLWAVKRFMPDNPWLGMLFVWASLMYFSFGVNGLRNGLACHLVLLGISFLYGSKYLPGVLFFLLAMGIHRSTMLPIVATVASLFMYRKPQLAIYVWLASIPVSLVAGGAVTSFFVSLGFDDRMMSYTESGNDMSEFSRTGFRWDFLLYSAMPVWMAWYVCVRRKIDDGWYNALCTVYCLCNAFWILVIRSSFSNRFAYLSWFLYPVMIAYPLINLPIWEDQDRKTGLILLAYVGFTLFMQMIYW